MNIQTTMVRNLEIFFDNTNLEFYVFVLYDFLSMQFNECLLPKFLAHIWLTIKI